jgi:hypothetical protein
VHRLSPQSSTHRISLSRHRFLTAKPTPLINRTFFPTRDMTDHSWSTRFRARFMSALQAYKQTTGVTLIEHPLAVQLQNCHSDDSIIILLKYEARPFSDLPGSDRIMESIESIVSILSTLCASASLGEGIGLVRQNASMGCPTSLSVFV